MRVALTPVSMARHVVGNAVVLYARAEISATAQQMALEVRPDPDRDIVVLDLHPELGVGFWEAIATALRPARRDLRLIVCGAGRETALLAGQFLADRLGRAVLAADDGVRRTDCGALFALGGPESGWIQYRPARAPQWTARRYPTPPWDAQVAAAFPTSAAAIADPLPGGVWLRHRDAEPDPLFTAMTFDPAHLTVVVGSPHTPALSLDDIARLWRTLSQPARDQTRFVQYGEVALGAATSFGQALAELLQTPVTCLTGIPTGPAQQPVIRTVVTDASPGWQTFAQHLLFAPGISAPPQIVGHREPAVLGESIGALRFQYATDAVVEIVPAGLWIRANSLAWYVDELRGRPLAPDRFEVLIDDADPAQVTRLRQLAEDLVARLDPDTQHRAHFLTASTGASIGDFAVPAAAPLAAVISIPTVETVPAAASTDNAPAAVATAVPATVVPSALVSAAVMPAELVPAAVEATRRLDERVKELGVAETQLLPPIPTYTPTPGISEAELPIAAPSGGSIAVPVTFFQQIPDRAACGVYDWSSIAADRVWLREVFAESHRAACADVERILAGYPGFHAEPDLIADSAALRMYLSGFGDEVSRTLRAGVPGPHVPFARCVAGALARMPIHQGPALLTVDLTPTELSWIATRPILTEWGFTEALSAPADLVGTVDVLIWTAGAAQTEPLEPTGAHNADRRVVFPPGARFQVLRTDEPTSSARGRLLLRHLPDGGHPDQFAAEVSVAELQRAADQWQLSPPVARVGQAVRSRLARVPGLS